jgi:uncharacterized protein with PIN domain
MSDSFSIKNNNDKLQAILVKNQSQDEIKRKFDNCPVCSTRLLFNYLTDYRHLIVQETSRCPQCQYEPDKKKYDLN